MKINSHLNILNASGVNSCIWIKRSKQQCILSLAI